MCSGCPAPDEPAALPLGELIRTHRRRAGLSQERLARMACVTQQHISALERGRAAMSSRLLERIDRVLRSYNCGLWNVN